MYLSINTHIYVYVKKRIKLATKFPLEKSRKKPLFPRVTKWRTSNAIRLIMLQDKNRNKFHFKLYPNFVSQQILERYILGFLSNQTETQAKKKGRRENVPETVHPWPENRPVWVKVRATRSKRSGKPWIGTRDFWVRSIGVFDQFVAENEKGREEAEGRGRNRGDRRSREMEFIFARVFQVSTNGA